MFAIFGGFLAGILHLTAYFIYGREVLRDRIQPNTSSWAVWALAAVLETASYAAVTKDWVKNILPVACSASAVALFTVCVARGRLQPLSRWEWIITTFDVGAIFVWWIYQSATYANALLVLTAIVSFAPLLAQARRDPHAEQPLPWCLWSAAYLCMTLVVLLRWEKLDDLLYPVVFLVLHLITACTVILGRSRQFVNSGVT